MERTIPGRASSAPDPRPGSFAITIIVPAYDEARSVGDTIRSLQAQTVLPERIIVVDDGSSDGTGDVARALGVEVVRPPANTGSKAGAQTFALPLVTTPFTMAIDADTILAPDAIARLRPAFDDPAVAAACGFVLPQRVRTVWERGRYVEYLFAFSFYKQVQDFYGKPTISSGCFSMYRTGPLREAGGWSTRTLAEDMDLTWTFYQRGWGVRFVPGAVCYPIEPHDLRFMRSQLRRWSHGFIQNVVLHGRGILRVPFLRSSVAVTLWDATVASLAYVILLPLLALLLWEPWPLLGYVLDLPALLVPVVAGARPRREVRRALASFPGFIVLRFLNTLLFLEAVWSEVIRGRKFVTYEKGH
jgi:biofilm PGA synthesis N-glycosyltransferase PgaC